MKKGFTIIELSLVLAIAGLIFLMMFVALPALQRNTRDTERKEDIGALVNAIKKYQSNNRGALPNEVPGTTSYERNTELGNVSSITWQGLLNDYLDDGFEDPDGNNYVLTIEKCTGTTGAVCDGYGSGDLTFPNGYKLYVVTQAKCSGDETTGAVGSSNPRKYAVIYKLEGGGLYCEDA